MAKKYYSSKKNGSMVSPIKTSEGSKCNLPNELKMVNASNGSSLNSIDYPDNMSGMDSAMNSDISRLNKMKHPKG